MLFNVAQHYLVLYVNLYTTMLFKHRPNPMLSRYVLRSTVNKPLNSHSNYGSATGRKDPCSLTLLNKYGLVVLYATFCNSTYGAATEGNDPCSLCFKKVSKSIVLLYVSLCTATLCRCSTGICFVVLYVHLCTTIQITKQ